ncbi:hypothetical protein COEREDRAFT_48163, partial [Coemansia reversa NRRL 1564]
NRNLTACLKFRHIVNGLREHGSVSKRFTLSGPAVNVLAGAFDDGPPVQHRRTG